MSQRPSRALVYARLLRLPNVFTALADIALGAAAAGYGHIGISFLWLGVSSALLYSAGMVWNDAFDVEQDALERPFRPIPSGQVSLQAAVAVAGLLTLAGWLAALLAGWQATIVSGCLIAAILAYDRWLKRTPFGPIGMGACRFLNVLLGLSAISTEAVDWGLRLHLASIVGVYVAGITWFAKSEARESDVRRLRLAVGVVLAALIVALALPLHFAPGTSSVLFPYLLVALGVVVIRPMARAVGRPTPPNVQRAVKTAVLAIIGLDAVLATAVVGAYGLVVLLLLPPALLLGRRVYST